MTISEYILFISVICGIILINIFKSQSNSKYLILIQAESFFMVFTNPPCPISLTRLFNLSSRPFCLHNVYQWAIPATNAQQAWPIKSQVNKECLVSGLKIKAKSDPIAADKSAIARTEIIKSIQSVVTNWFHGLRWFRVDIFQPCSYPEDFWESQNYKRRYLQQYVDIVESAIFTETGEAWTCAVDAWLWWAWPPMFCRIAEYAIDTAMNTKAIVIRVMVASWVRFSWDQDK